MSALPLTGAYSMFSYYSAPAPYAARALHRADQWINLAPMASMMLGRRRPAG